MKQLIGIIVLVIGIIGAAVVFSGGGDDVAGAVSNNFYGQESATVTVTEFADFECPACAQFFPIISQVKEQFKDQVRFEFKHFPLVQIHPNSIAAHRAAQAAAKQGKFWEMHDLLYERQTSWRAQSNGTGVSTNSNPGLTFERYAEELGLDVEQYKLDVSANETIGTINADIAAGKAKGAVSTPTFYINGKLVEDLASLATPEGFASVIQTAIDDAEVSSDLGTDTVQPVEEAIKPEEEVPTDQ
jgi:protein-disulfide isomerase